MAIKWCLCVYMTFTLITNKGIETSHIRVKYNRNLFVFRSLDLVGDSGQDAYKLVLFGQFVAHGLTYDAQQRSKQQLETLPVSHVVRGFLQQPENNHRQTSQH